MRPAGVEIVRLTAARMDDMGAVLRGSWGNGCWCMHPRVNAAVARTLPGPGSAQQRRKRAMTALARRKRAPGLLAYLDGEPVGWVAIAPRPELVRIERSKATPRVDDVPVWVIPCITVSPRARGRGIAVQLIRAAVDYAAEQGAEAVEAYPRAANKRIEDDFAFFGTEKLFRKAGFAVIRKPIRGQPK
ncbi:MAG TPA: GNAT family N-acetyltransferase, partial [Kofleriaceae bacterium]|nr:GNAT family N-acetyltransferase [Kofleriaceae bacterium]